MIRVGIVGCNYGRTVLLPAFRADPRCEVTALAGSDAARTRVLADAAGVSKAYGDWRALVEDADIDVVAIATRELEKLVAVVDPARQVGQRDDHAVERLLLLAQRLCPLGVVPDVRILELARHLLASRGLHIEVKDTSAARPCGSSGRRAWRRCG